MDITAICVKNEQEANGRHMATLELPNGQRLQVPADKPFVVGNKYTMNVQGNFDDPAAAKPKPAEPPKPPAPVAAQPVIPPKPAEVKPVTTS